MHLLRHGIAWVFALVFALLTLSMLLLHHRLQALLLFAALLLCLPPLEPLLRRRMGIALRPLPRFVACAALFALSMALLPDAKNTSLYDSPQIEARMMAIYDTKMREWPLPYEERFLRTSYGTVHVIVSGEAHLPPLLLLHASGAGSWSWKFNAAGLGRRYRLYAVDLIGDAGKSAYADPRRVLRNGRDQAALYAEITEKLGIGRADVVGASEGGFIASNYALYHPERVRKLVLIAPMGYAGTAGTVVRILLAQLFPLPWVQDATFRWAFSDSSALQEEFGEWFRLLMGGCRPLKVVPLPLSAGEKRKLRVPLLFLFGSRDNLVGEPEAAAASVRDIPDAAVEVVDAGHLAAAEKPETVNALITDFLGADGGNLRKEP